MPWAAAVPRTMGGGDAMAPSWTAIGPDSVAILSEGARTAPGTHAAPARAARSARTAAEGRASVAPQRRPTSARTARERRQIGTGAGSPAEAQRVRARAQQQRPRLAGESVLNAMPEAVQTSRRAKATYEGLFLFSVALPPYAVQVVGPGTRRLGAKPGGIQRGPAARGAASPVEAEHHTARSPGRATAAPPPPGGGWRQRPTLPGEGAPSTH